jgi:hypothetical protein
MSWGVSVKQQHKHEHEHEHGCPYVPATTNTFTLRSTHKKHKARQDGDARVLPPLLAAHAARAAAERVRLPRERVRLVDEQVEALAALQD